MSAPSKASSRWPGVTLAVLQILQLVSLVPWLFLAGFAVMAFDAPGSTETWQPSALVFAIWSYPLWLLVAGIASWVFFWRGNPRVALGVGLVFTLPALAIGGLVLLGATASRLA